MKTTQFNNLALVDRAWLISAFGKFLMSIEYNDYRINLYSLNGQFIELFQNMTADKSKEFNYQAT